MTETVLDIDVHEHRETDWEIEPLLVERWSPRAMSGESLSEEELLPLFEAARWAPSSYNSQPWRFLVARRDTPSWDPFFDFLVEFNQGWAERAAALVVVLSQRENEKGRKLSTHSFDTGAAWQNLALEGRRLGLVVHAMAGYDGEKARQQLDLGDEMAIEAMIAIGRPAPPEVLPDDLVEREEPNSRKPVDELVRFDPLSD